MKKYTYTCDMGSIMIATENNTVRFYFSNRVGDGSYTVRVETDIKKFNEFDETRYEFISHFEVHGEGIAILYDYDCGDDIKPLHTFTSGRYPVFAKENGDMLIGSWS